MICVLPVRTLLALDPHKSLTQYSRTFWTQQDGLPQDTIRAIVQTRDGYLWLGTDEGLARFDGYEFVVFTKANGDLPSNSVTSLAADTDGSLWIGTSNGLAHYQGHEFHTYSTRQGLPDNNISMLYTDHADTLWMVAGVNLCRFQGGKFQTFSPGADLPVTFMRTVAEDSQHQLWVAGFTGVGEFIGGKYTPVLSAADLRGELITALLPDDRGNLWVSGNDGVVLRAPNGRLSRFGVADGLPDPFVRMVWIDRDGGVWAGTNGGLARLTGDRFVSLRTGAEPDREQVRCMYEDREGDMWVGSNDGLSRLRDDVFTVYGKPEGLPSDEPNTVFQDSSGRIWIGFHDAGLMLFAGDKSRVYTTRDGLPNNEVYAIREMGNGDLLISARGGMVRMHNGAFTTYIPPDPLSRLNVFDAMEDWTGKIWLATSGGLLQLRGRDFVKVVDSGAILSSAVVTLCEGQDGALWAGTYGKGLWFIQGDAKRLYTSRDGLSGDQVRSVHQDVDGTLWIATFGGGLNSLRNGKFQHFTANDGLLSDNVAKVADDGESLWLSTTRGICRIPKEQLREFAAGKRKRLNPVNYGVEDGLRSAQCAPSYPIGRGGERMADGRIWFSTSRGLAVYDPHVRKQARLAPLVHILEMTSNGEPVNLSGPIRLEPGGQRVQIRYSAVHLSAPEQVRYSYKLDGVDPEWVHAGTRRVINYNLRHGNQRFWVRAELPGGVAAEQSLSFVLLPWFYETAWFRSLCVLALVAVAWAVYQLRLRQIRYRFALVLEERARLAREIHDTLAQGFVGISSQLDAVAMCMPDETSPARKFLDMARRMARHSLTEARRSVMDLRASVLEGQALGAALESGARMWTVGSGVEVEVDSDGPPRELPQEVEQHLLRIAQEAVTNAMKHAGATQIAIKLHMEARKLLLRIVDNGRGFEQKDAFSSMDGHFGLIGMRERAERLGGELRLASHPGEGTEVEVMVPLP
ncbi:MAG: two-component regulator propeller domain-containing protein [Candidatus Sulfopaludibacter sp.]|nr:two-component regulator propeller domain-containing protein [Candidatus Sulfopaludibacter sp.]